MSETEKKPSLLSEYGSFIAILLLGAFLRLFIFTPYMVPTSSMRATILEGDYIFATIYSYGYSNHSFPFSPNLFEGRIFDTKPTRGDVIIIRPPVDMQRFFIKRLIALPGDKIEIVDNVTYINDQPIKRDYLGTYISEDKQEYDKYLEKLDNGVEYYTYYLRDLPFNIQNEMANRGPIIVPNGHYFFMGDNRFESGDSRMWGTVPYSHIIAKARFIMFSTANLLWPENSSYVDAFSNFIPWITSIRFSRIFSTFKADDAGNGETKPTNDATIKAQSNG